MWVFLGGWYYWQLLQSAKCEKIRPFSAGTLDFITLCPCESGTKVAIRQDCDLGPAHLQVNI